MSSWLHFPKAQWCLSGLVQFCQVNFSQEWISGFCDGCGMCTHTYTHAAETAAGHTMLWTARCALMSPRIVHQEQLLLLEVWQVPALLPCRMQWELLPWCSGWEVSTIPHVKSVFLRCESSVPGPQIPPCWDIVGVSGDCNINMQTMQVVINSSHSSLLGEIFNVRGGSNSEHSFKNTAHNSAATFLVCVHKTESSCLLATNIMLWIFFLLPWKITTVIYSRETYFRRNNNIYIVHSLKKCYIVSKLYFFLF